MIYSDPKNMFNTAFLPRSTRQTADSSTQNEANLNKCCNLFYLFIHVISICKQPSEIKSIYQ